MQEAHNGLEVNLTGAEEKLIQFTYSGIFSDRIIIGLGWLAAWKTGSYAALTLCCFLASSLLSGFLNASLTDSDGKSTVQISNKML